MDVVQLEDALETRKIQQNQLKLQEKQTSFNKYLLWTTITIALIAFYPISDKIITFLEFPEMVKIIAPIVIAALILWLVIQLIIVFFSEIYIHKT